MSELAAAIADGEAVDWERVQRRFKEGSEADLVRNLRLLDQVADAAFAESRASLGLDTDGLERTAGLSRRSRTSGLSRAPLPLPWSLRLMVAMAVVQVASGLFLAVTTQNGPENVPRFLPALTAAVFGISAAILLRTGSFDHRTRPLAGVFLALASPAALAFLPEGIWEPESSKRLLWMTVIFPECFLPYFLWRFVEAFPRILRQSRSSAVIRWGWKLSAWTGGLLFAANAGARLFLPQDSALWAPMSYLGPNPGSYYWSILFALAIPATVVGYVRFREAPEEEQRRVRIFARGLGAGFFPLLAIVTLESNPAFKAFLETAGNRERFSYLIYLSLLTIPLTTSYAVAAQRLLSLRLILHRAARWALAKGTLWLVALTPVGLLATVLWQKSSESLTDLLASGPVPLLLGLAALGAGLLVFRRPLLKRLEDSLLGRKSPAGTVLASFHQALSSLRDFQELEGLVRSHARDLVQAEEAHLLLRRERDSRWCSATGHHRGLDDASSVMRLATVSPEPFSLDSRDRDSVLPWIPEEDRHWAAEGDIQLAIPLVDSSGDQQGLLCVGPTRSGLPYAAEERQALRALASGAVLALRRIHEASAIPATGKSPEAAQPPAGECRGCGKVSPESKGHCSCGNPWSAAALPFDLAGKFRLQGLLGEGGMGLVYRALDQGLDRPVALKTLPRLRSDALLRLRREARSMARFIHPGLALIFGVETWRGVPVLVVEYLAGGTLDRRLGEPWPSDDAVRLVIRLTEALTAIHEAGLLHRDIKPSNIGFSAAGEAKLLDFGLAKLVEEARVPAPTLKAPSKVAPADIGRRLTRTDSIVGTPLYLSPEALEGAPPSPAQDLWSLWIVLWELLAGRHPFFGLPFDEALGKIRRGRLPDFTQIRPQGPEEVARAIRQGLHPEMSRRPATAGDVRTLLQTLLPATS